MKNAISASPFNHARFVRTLMKAAGDGDGDPVYQLDYLARYCTQLGAKTVIAEKHYVDRHFLDEFALYYSRNLHPPLNSVRRFHLFKRRISDAQLTALLEARSAVDGVEGDRLDAHAADDYLGFVSIRPIPGAPVGRTVLRRLEGGEHRDIWATGKHWVHLGNLRLEVEGLPFQQQDEAVGACATAALWSALSQVTRRDGMRAPTPAEVSDAASRHVLATGRALPAVCGLTVEQLSEAVRQKGLAPEFVSAESHPEVFVAAVHTYLRSGIPVVLSMRALEGTDDPDDPDRITIGEGHAVTAVGFQCHGVSNAVLESTVPLNSAYIRKLYVHDDRLGPYARAFLRPARWRRDEQGLDQGNGRPTWVPVSEDLILEIETKRDPTDSSQEPNPDGLERWLVDAALVPVYSKLRLPVRSLITLADLVATPIEAIVGARARDLRVDLFYMRSGEYLRHLNGRIGSGAAEFFRKVSLPRWCGIVRWLLGSDPLVDFVYDTTDILRSSKSTMFRDTRKLLRAVVTRNQAYRAHVRPFGECFEVPWI